METVAAGGGMRSWPHPTSKTPLSVKPHSRSVRLSRLWAATRSQGQQQRAFCTPPGEGKQPPSEGKAEPVAKSGFENFYPKGFEKLNGTKSKGEAKAKSSTNNTNGGSTGGDGKGPSTSLTPPYPTALTSSSQSCVVLHRG